MSMRFVSLKGDEMIEKAWENFDRLVNVGPCLYCGGEDSLINGSEIHCTTELCGAISDFGQLFWIFYQGMKVGLIEGRHPMPVEKYLLTQDQVDAAGAVNMHNAIYGLASDAARKLVVPNGMVALYFSGLTPVVMGAVDGFTRSGIRVILMSYDREMNDYVPVRINATAFK